MRGGFLHNQVLIDPLERAFRRAGATTRREFAVQVEETVGYVDLFVACEGWRCAIEAERSPDRVPGDIKKAEALDVDALWIVVPTANVARSARRKLDGLRFRFDRGRVFVLTQGQALHRVAHCLPLIAGR